MIPKQEKWDETLTVDKETQENWRMYLVEFEMKFLPIMLSHGYSRDTAMIVWQLNRLYNVVDRIEDILLEQKP